MSIDETHQPYRGSDVETWLKMKRDEQDKTLVAGIGRPGWDALDGLLDEYRLRADTGLTLDRSIEEAGEGGAPCST